MTDNFNFMATGKLPECKGTNAMMVVSGAQVISAKINNAIVADVNAVVREA
jgi:hypothetical protein